MADEARFGVPGEYDAAWQNMVTVAPHNFSPLRPWDLRSNGRCKCCYLPMHAHPIHYWARARALRDKRAARLEYPYLSGEKP